MAPEKKDKKRKAASTTTADSPAKKTKKVEDKETPKSILKKKKSSAAAVDEKTISKPKANGDAPRPIKPRKRAADFLSDDDEDSEPEVEKAVTEKNTKKPSSKKSKQADGTAATAKSSKKADAKAKKAEKIEIVASDSDEDEEKEEDAPTNSESEDEGEDDQTAALIRGFESSGDEDESADEGLEPGAPVPKIPDSKKAKRKILKLQKQDKADASEEPGTVYVGRIPHGFYEHQMRAYFSQFGEISKLRLSRNRITGRSKHYAFIEFASRSVAKIVAATMDNYLMYGHILKCKYVAPEQLHPEVWKGANRRFKRTPWNRIEKKRLEKGKTREQWTKRIEQEQKRRQIKAQKLKALGYEFALPELKSVDDVPVQETKAVEDGEQTKAIEASVAEPEPAPVAVEEKKVEETTPKKKSKKEKKAAQSPANAKASPKPAQEAAAASPATKAKGKGKSKPKAKA